MPVKIEPKDSAVTALLEGEIDHHSAQSMREAIDAAAIRLRPEVLRLDFSGVGFMDSSGVGLIMGRYRLMSEMGGALEVANVPEKMAKMMKMSGLCRLGIKGLN